MMNPACSTSRSPGWRPVVVAILAATALLSEQSTAADYIASEQVAPDSASQLLTPLDGLSPEVLDMGDPGIFAERIGSRVPLFTEMLSESVLTVSPRFYYFYSSTDDVIREEAAYGGLVSLKTGWWQDFLRLGFSGATSQALYTPDGRGGTGLLQRGGHGYWTPGEMYVEANFGDLFSVKGFRQELDLPYFNRNDSRMTPKVHEAYTVTSGAIPDLYFGVSHITKVKDRISDDFLSLSEVAGAEGTDRGATLVGFRYHWREDQSNIGAMNAAGWDTFNTLYAESTHSWDLPGDFDFNLSSQFTHQQSIGDELVGNFETWSIGGQAALSYAGLVATLGYTSTDQGAAIRNPWGGSPLFNSVMISDFDRAGENAWRVGLSYPFERIGLPGVSAFASYVHGNTPEFGPAASPDEEEFNVSVDLRPEKGPLKDFWLRVRYGWNDGLLDANHETFRVILNYSIQF